MDSIDVAATQAINQLAGRASVLDFCMVGVSTIAVPLLIVVVAFQWWRRRERLHVRHVLVAAGLSCLLGLALNQVVLLFVQRQRPYDAGLTHLLITTSTDPSFPFRPRDGERGHRVRFPVARDGSGRAVVFCRCLSRDDLPCLHRHALCERRIWRCPNDSRCGGSRSIALSGRHVR